MVDARFLPVTVLARADQSDLVIKPASTEAQGL